MAASLAAVSACVARAQAPVPRARLTAASGVGKASLGGGGKLARCAPSSSKVLSTNPALARRAVTRTASTSEDLLVDDGAGLLDRITADIDCVVLDCDGVIWQGNTLLPGVRESIQLLRDMGKRLVFVTNNSNKSRKQYVHKFEQFGITVEKEEVFSAAFAAAAYLKTQAVTGKVYVVGGQGIVDELNEMHIEVDPGVFGAVKCTEDDWTELIVEDDVKAVIVGQDLEFTFAKLCYASLAIQQGAKFVATNPDHADVLGGLRVKMPGAGACVAAVEVACGESPEIYAGKPSAFLLELLKGNYVNMERTLVVGDRLDTDMAFGKAGDAGLTVLVLTGVSTLEDVDAAIEAGNPNVPDHVVMGLPQMLGLEPEDSTLLEFMDEDIPQGEVDMEEDDRARAAFGAIENA
uniref:Phosphoglycolate phosphatase n=1 Tax=Mantoniella antarctica TaxID=81844 RepID=A0A7S0SPZ5_9CHLO|mmetsp:Transcript_33479/g.84338  ORF Transcript_33479/g.84338 Transcript_33479/m.84338 type:complete len:406 (+) Transcript_33479:179-1396(+)